MSMVSYEKMHAIQSEIIRKQESEINDLRASKAILEATNKTLAEAFPEPCHVRDATGYSCRSASLTAASSSAWSARSTMTSSLSGHEKSPQRSGNSECGQIN